MDYSCVRFTDLPDEILMIICQKLNNFDVLYCLKGVNQRIDRIVHDSTFTSRLSFVKWSKCNFIDLLHCDTILNRYCLQILPDISMKIHWLYLESSSVKHILGVGNYPNLYGLGLYNIEEKTSKYLFNDKKIQLEFNLSQHARDEELMRAIASYFKAGSVSLNRNAFVFRVVNFSELTEIIIPFFINPFKYPIDNSPYVL